jgi:hypothetical protein
MFKKRVNNLLSLMVLARGNSKNFIHTQTRFLGRGHKKGKKKRKIKCKMGGREGPKKNKRFDR